MTWTARCGCQPTTGWICPDHCQIQGCSRDGSRHTAACVRGDRVSPYYRTWHDGDPIPTQDR